jgi:hypothetical protein
MKDWTIAIIPSPNWHSDNFAEKYYWLTSIVIGGCIAAALGKSRELLSCAGYVGHVTLVLKKLVVCAVSKIKHDTADFF